MRLKLKPVRPTIAEQDAKTIQNMLDVNVAGLEQALFRARMIYSMYIYLYLLYGSLMLFLFLFAKLACAFFDPAAACLQHCVVVMGCNGG